MQTELLFELTYILLDKKSVTASEMAEHFGVSRRTIYRWLDALNLAGVPVVSVKGKGGGISLSEKYTLDKAILSQEEKLEILSGVQALSVLSGKQNPLISKIKAFSKENADWIKIDFAPWNFKNEEIRSLFTMIKSAILSKKQVEFSYYSSSGEFSVRKVDPWKIVFRGQAWYLYGFCKNRSEPRYFKLTRIQNFKMLSEKITENEEKFCKAENQKRSRFGVKNYSDFPLIKLKILLDEKYISYFLDEYKVEKIEDSSCTGKKILEIAINETPYLKNLLLSFGSALKVLSPEKIKNEIESEISLMSKLNFVC